MALQDMWSGDYGTSNQYVKYDIEVVEEWTDTAGNLSNLTVRVWAWRTNTYGPTYGTGTCYCSIDGSQYTQGITSSQKIGTTKICLFEKNLNVGHNADGTKTVQVYAYISMDVVSSSNQGGGFNLTTIARASQPTLSASTANMGTAITIYMNRASTGFTHTVKYSFGSDNATIATGVTDSTSWTIPLTLANQIPSAASGWGTIIVDTYSGATLIGTKSTTFTANCPSTMVPTFTSVTHSEANTTVSGKAIGSYVQGLSQLAMVINGAAGTYGSTISKYEFTIDGTLYSGSTNSVTSNALKTSGTLTLTATITDTRGRTATKTASVTVLAYAPPVITQFLIQRANSDGTLNDMGTYVKVTRAGTWSVLGTKNTCSIVVKTSPRGTNTWTTKSTVAGGTAGSLASSSVVISTYSATSSFDFSLEFTDIFNTTISLTVLSTGQVTMSWGPTGIGIGKVWQQGALDVSGDAFFDIGTGRIMGRLGYTAQSGNRGSSTNQWVRICTVNIVSQYQDINTTVEVVTNGSGDSTMHACQLRLRVKQQAAMGSAPGVHLVISDQVRFIATNFVAVTSVNTASKTSVELWAQITNTYDSIVYSVLYSSSTSQIVWDSGYAVAAAYSAGTVTACVRDGIAEVLGVDGGGQSLAVNTWYRATWNTPWADEGILWNYTETNMFGVPETGWYEVSYWVQINQSVSTPYYAQIWRNHSSAGYYGLISQFTTNNGWNSMFGTVFIPMDANVPYEIVIRQEDNAYTRSVDSHKLRIKRIA